jgi:hypothetical protein
MTAAAALLPLPRLVSAVSDSSPLARLSRLRGFGIKVWLTIAGKLGGLEEAAADGILTPRIAIAIMATD